MSQLIRVPSMMVDNGDEKPIQVNFYNGSIELCQCGNYLEPDRIMLQPEYVKKIFKAIISALPEATELLQKR